MVKVDCAKARASWTEALSLDSALWRYSTDPEFVDLHEVPTLGPEHPVIVHLLQMNRSTVLKVLHVLDSLVYHTDAMFSVFFICSDFCVVI